MRSGGMFRMFRLFCCLATALALALSGPGVMAAAMGKTSAILIEICGGDGARTVLVEPGQRPVEDHGACDKCPFCQSLAAGAVPAVTVATRVSGPRAGVDLPARHILKVSLTRLRPCPRAPPARIQAAAITGGREIGVNAAFGLSPRHLASARCLAGRSEQAIGRPRKDA